MTGLAAANGHDTGLRRRKTSASLSDGEPAKAQRADKSRHVGARWELPRKVLHGSVGVYLLPLSAFTFVELTIGP